MTRAVIVMMAAAPQADAASGEPTSCFSPKANCTSVIVEQIQQATNEIRVAAYYFTNQKIADALAAAQKNGILVRIVIDRSQDDPKFKATLGTSTPTCWFLDHGISAWVYKPKGRGIQHNKFMIIDEYILVTGSFNYTNRAEKSNRENILVIKNKNEILKYIDNWEEMKRESRPPAPCPYGPLQPQRTPRSR